MIQSNVQLKTLRTRDNGGRLGKFQKGDRVRLTSAMAMVMARGVAPRRHRLVIKLKWLSRTGVVCRSPRYGDNITVRWDDNTTQIDQWPQRALEKIEEV